MIVTQLIGGLGNQLFQYAAGRALAAKRGVDLRFDPSLLETSGARTYALDNFKIAGAVLDPLERSQLGLRPEPRTRASRLIRKLTGSEPSIHVVRERTFRFDPSVLDAPAPCLLQGYWQSPKYFADIESTIRRELSWRNPPWNRNREMAERVRSCVSVAVHVRRGDYVTSAATNRYHGTCSPEYYLRAEEFLRAKLGELELFVFSDDPDWVEEHLRFASPATVVRHNGVEQDHEDLRLMTHCRHHIIANSTFSWWGAWLCSYSAKAVIAPAAWFRDAAHSTADLIPRDWTQL